jgi:predicted DNA-binding transcriptional regulator YafY
MGRKGQSITLSIGEREKKQLEVLAAEQGMTWGDKPNISRLLKAIARQELLIAPNHDWTQERIQALERARQGLIDLGKVEDAREIARLLVQRSELKAPFRRELENFLDAPQTGWRQQIDRYIRERQPFKLAYRDAADRAFQFHVLHAQVQLLEKRQYLVCRCEETEGNQDIPELRHNWTFRLDRIQEAAVTSIERPWEVDLQRVAVEFHLSGGLAFAYRDPNNQDRFMSDLEGDPPIRRVIRLIYSTFWFFRSIAPYWGDCIIISPENVRMLYREKVRLLYEQYFCRFAD